MTRKANGVPVSEYWQIGCPACPCITYYRVVNPVGPDLAKYRKWPFLQCRSCGHWYTKREADASKHCVSEKLEEPVRLLVKRQALDIYLEVKK